MRNIHSRQKLPDTPGGIMAIRATTADYSSALALYDALSLKNKETAENANNPMSLLSGLGSSGGASGGVSSLLSAQGREEILKALESMKKEGYKSFTFADIEDYRKKLEADFSSAVRSDLRDMGVDEDIAFTLVLDASGNIQVISDHPDKAAVTAYFEDNPEMVDVFKHVQALSNIKKNRQKAASSGNPLAKELKTSLQAEALSAFFDTLESGSDDYFSQIANFGSNGATSYLLGVNRKV